jgi:hypothetical protein
VAHCRGIETSESREGWPTLVSDLAQDPARSAVAVVVLNDWVVKRASSTPDMRPHSANVVYSGTDAVYSTAGPAVNLALKIEEPQK